MLLMDEIFEFAFHKLRGSLNGLSKLLYMSLVNVFSENISFGDVLLIEL